MKVSEMLKSGKTTISFEVFPPKKDDGLASVLASAKQIASLAPDFMSVTYGAAGTTRENTVRVASEISQTFGVPVVPHMTCMGADREEASALLDRITAAGIGNVMALRGDVPKDGDIRKDFAHASDLISFIREKCPDISIGGACYPEGHVECAHKEEDISFLKKKAECGCDYLVTQMFFDNNIFYNFLYRCLAAGVDIPIVPGIMPITSARQLARSAALSGTNVPEKLRAVTDRFGDSPEAMQQAGVVYASEQIIDLLANGVRNIHIYSMNKPEVAAAILHNVRSCLDA